MKKIEVTLKNVVNVIREFYKPHKHHFLTLNGVAIDEQTTEIQWIFSEYGAMDKITLFYTDVKEDELIPSIVEIIPSAIISQREIVDMFGLKVEDSQSGLYLDEDSLQKPLSYGCAL
ncbi:MAG: NADH-quinone oxidoreductase subunit C [Sulfurimonas sp.]